MVYITFLSNLGANRLGANSLLDIVIFGRQAAITCKELIKPNAPHPKYSPSLGEEVIAKVDRIRYCNGKTPTAEIRTKLQNNMQRNAGVYRIEKTLKEGCKLIDETLKLWDDIGIKDRVTFFIKIVVSHLEH